MEHSDIFSPLLPLTLPPRQPEIDSLHLNQSSLVPSRRVDEDVEAFDHYATSTAIYLNMTKPTMSVHRVTKDITSYPTRRTPTLNTTQPTNPAAIDRKALSEVMAPIMQSFHEQYKKNLEIQHENELAREIRQIYCKGFSASQTPSGDTVADKRIVSRIGTRIANMLVPIRFRSIFALTGVRKSSSLCHGTRKKFGYQPFTVYNNKNDTIGTDGWSIHPFSNCFWKSNLINLNGKNVSLGT